MRRTILALLLIAAVVTGGSFFLSGHKPEATAPESISGQATATPVATAPPTAHSPPPSIASDTNAELRRILNCHHLLLTRNGIQRTICDYIAGDVNAAQERCRTEMSRVNQELKEQEARSGPCPEKLAAPSEYYAALREFALQGNLNAQRCFIQGYFGESAEEMILLTQAQYDEHPVLARKFIEEGFERGDWSLVHVLARTRMGFPGDSNLFNAWPHGLSTPESAENAYKMNYLLLLGSRPEEYESNDPGRLIDHWRRNPHLLQLTNEQLDEAEAWAKDLYRRHFAASKPEASSYREKFCSAD